MSIGIVVNGPEGLVLAAESRVTLTATPPKGPQIHVNYDNATKILSFKEPHNYIGVVTYGLAAIQMRTPFSYIPEFEAVLPSNRITISEFAEKLSEFFIEQWQKNMPKDYRGPNITFVIAGFNEEEPYGSVYSVDIPRNPHPVLRTSKGTFGITWGGQRELVDRLIQGYDFKVIEIIKKTINPNNEQIEDLKKKMQELSMNIPFPAMALQDCVDLAIYFVRTTIIGQKLSVGIRGCGGPIDVATITRRESLKFIQKKEIIGEQNLYYFGD